MREAGRGEAGEREGRKKQRPREGEQDWDCPSSSPSQWRGTLPTKPSTHLYVFLEVKLASLQNS